MAVSFVAGTGAANAATASPTIALSASAAVGDIAIVFIQSELLTGSTFGLPSGGGVATWQALATRQPATGDFPFYAWYGTVTTAGGGTVTLSGSGSDVSRDGYMVIRGSHTAPLDIKVVHSAAATNTSPAMAIVPNGMLVVLDGCESGNAVTNVCSTATPALTVTEQYDGGTITEDCWLAAYTAPTTTSANTLVVTSTRSIVPLGNVHTTVYTTWGQTQATATMVAAGLQATSSATAQARITGTLANVGLQAVASGVATARITATTQATGQQATTVMAAQARVTGTLASVGLQAIASGVATASVTGQMAANGQMSTSSLVAQAQASGSLLSTGLQAVASGAATAQSLATLSVTGLQATTQMAGTNTPPGTNDALLATIGPMAVASMTGVEANAASLQAVGPFASSSAFASAQSTGSLATVGPEAQASGTGTLPNVAQLQAVGPAAQANMAAVSPTPGDHPRRYQVPRDLRTVTVDKDDRVSVAMPYSRVTVVPADLRTTIVQGSGGRVAIST
jgi:hypothetical protein